MPARRDSLQVSSGSARFSTEWRGAPGRAMAGKRVGHAETDTVRPIATTVRSAGADAVGGDVEVGESDRACQRRGGEAPRPGGGDGEAEPGEARHRGDGEAGDEAR